MKRTMGIKAPALLLVGLMLLAFLGAAPAPVRGDATPPSSSPSPQTAKPSVQVKTVDELVAAIGPDVTVELLPGEYDLADAASYGKDTGNPFCSWGTSSEQGFELCVSGVDGLTIHGAGGDETVLIAEDRYANVLCFNGCQDLTVSMLTAGHSPMPGFCSGGVLNLVNCSRATVVDCGLFGCGSMGVWALNCSDVTVVDSRIYECSCNAVCADGCRNMQVLDSEIDHNGWKTGGAYCLFQVSGGSGFVVSGCRVHDNVANLLLQTSFTTNVRFLSNRVEYNTLQSAFALFEYPATVDGCVFYNNDLSDWYAQDEGMLPRVACDAEGKDLSEDDLAAMVIRSVQLPDIEVPAPKEPTEVAPGGEITVTTASEFLAAIGPDRTIVLDGDSFSLADASDYGSGAGMYYRWEETYDGPQLVIFGASNLTIRAAAGREAVTLTAAPRYANVIGFESCDNVRVEGLVLGHTEGPSDCCGAVLDFEYCNNVSLDACRLYGCGTLGVNAWYCIDLRLTDCEIYDCSLGGAVLGSVSGATFRNCRIHDVPSPALSLYGCGGVIWNDLAVYGEHYDVSPEGELQPVIVG